MMQFAADAECQRLVADLLAYMSPVEKAGQLAMRHAPDPDDREAMEQVVGDIRKGRLGSIQSIRDRDQANNFQQIAQNEARLGIPLLFPEETGTGIDTIFPTPFAASASWDMDALEAAEGIIAQEAYGRGLNWALSPEMSFADEKGGTLVDSCGQDIHLAARIATARIRGLQGAQGNGWTSLLACLELSGLPSDNSSGNMGAGPTAVLEIAHAAIKGADVGAIAYDRMGGKLRQAVENAFGFLKGPGGFDGILLSDWEQLVRELAGSDIPQARQGVPVDTLVAAIERGQCPEERIDAMVARVLRAKFRLGLLRAPFSAKVTHQESALPTPIHNREVALELAKRSAVLLRNDPALLPLGIDSGDVLLVGAAAANRTTPLAGRSGIAASVIDGLEQLGVPHRFVPGLALRGDGKLAGDMIAADSMAIGMASEAAKRAGTVVLALSDSTTGEIGEANKQLLSALFSANQRLVLVTMGVRPIDPQLSRESIPVILHAGQLGTMSGHAIAELLTGECAPSGKLSLEICRVDGSISLPFGHGLTYADFALTDLSIETGRDRIYVMAQLRNTGERKGTETVQLYLRRRRAEGGEQSERMPLADFQRVRLRAGERASLTFEIGREELGEHYEDGSFRVESGAFDVFLGLSSKRGLAGDINVSAELARAMAGYGVHPSPIGASRASRRIA